MGLGTRLLARLLATGGRHRLALALLAGAALAGPAAAQLVLYEHDDYQGRAFTASGPTANLTQAGFNDQASSVVVRQGRWQLCSDIGYEGQCIVLSPGSYPSLRAMGLNDMVSSARPLVAGGSGPFGGWGGGGAAIELYEHDDYLGRRLESDRGSHDLGRERFDRLASSVVVRQGRWELCSEPDFRGRCITLGPGSTGRLRDLDMNDAIVSLRPAGGGAGWGGGREPWHGDDGGAPEITLSANRYARVTFDNGCIVYYNGQGQRFQNLPSCDGRQVRRADEAMARLRGERGWTRADGEHPWSRRSASEAPPEVFVAANREGEVIFRNHCVAYYNARGQRWKQQPNCSGEQLRQADVAMASQRRELGL